jgi:hypothetical protein
MTPRLLLHRLLALVRSRRLDRELEGEMQAHLELAERDAIAAGLSPEEARRADFHWLGAVGRLRLFEVSALDPIAFVLAGGAMAVVALLAVLVPASRATRVDPVSALRVDV